MQRDWGTFHPHPNHSPIKGEGIFPQRPHPTLSRGERGIVWYPLPNLPPQGEGTFGLGAADGWVLEGAGEGVGADWDAFGCGDFPYLPEGDFVCLPGRL